MTDWNMDSRPSEYSRPTETEFDMIKRRVKRLEDRTLYLEIGGLVLAFTVLALLVVLVV